MALFPVRFDPVRAAAFVAAGHWTNALITDYLDRHALATPARTAFIDSRRRIDYAGLQALSYRLADGLAQRGIGAGDGVAIQLPNWIEFVALHLALVRIGAVTCPITPMSRAREVSAMLRVAKAKVLVIADTFRSFNYLEMARGLRDAGDVAIECIVLGSPADDFGVAYADVLGAGSDAPDARQRIDAMRPDANAITEIVFTSGTAGDPKGVIHSHNTLLAPQLAMAQSLHLGEGSVLHIASTVAHQTGFLNGIRLPVQVGGTCVMQDVWNAEEFVRMVAEHRIEASSGSATFLLDIMRCHALDRSDMSSFRVFRCGGGPIPLALVKEAEERLPNLRVLRGWGQTENGVVTLTRLTDAFARRMETDGCAQPGMQVRVVDDANRLLTPGVEGRLQCQGPFLFLGYANSPDLAAQDYVGEWFDTGDLATLDEQGYIRITGRVKDVIIRGGEKIPVHYVENVLFEDPRVLEACLVGMPDERLGERACAFVICRAGQQLSLEEMRAFLAAKGVATQYWPERLEVVDALPRTANGKVRKAALRDGLQDTIRAAGDR